MKRQLTRTFILVLVLALVIQFGHLPQLWAQLISFKPPLGKLLTHHSVIIAITTWLLWYQNQVELNTKYNSTKSPTMELHYQSFKINNSSRYNQLLLVHVAGLNSCLIQKIPSWLSLLLLMVLSHLKWSKPPKVLTMWFGRSKTHRQELTTLMWRVVTLTSTSVLIITSIFTRQWLEAHLLLCSTSKTEIYKFFPMASSRSTTLVCLIDRFCFLFFKCL